MDVDDRAHGDRLASLPARRPGERHAAETGSIFNRKSARAVELRLCTDIPCLLRVELEIGPDLPVVGCERLGELDPFDEPLARRPQGELRVDVDDPGEVDDGEEQIAELRED